MNPSFEFQSKERNSYLNQRIQASLEGSHFFPGGFSCSGVTAALGESRSPQLGARGDGGSRRRWGATRRKEEEERRGRVVMMSLGDDDYLS